MYLGLDPSGTVVLRVPKGKYYFDGYVTTYNDVPGWPPTTDFTEPALAVDGTHTEYTLDARDGVPIGFTTDEPTAAAGQAAVVAMGNFVGRSNAIPSKRAERSRSRLM